MITLKENGLIDETRLEGDEIIIFKLFLLMEKRRHEEDIRLINKTIKSLSPSAPAGKPRRD